MMLAMLIIRRQTHAKGLHHPGSCWQAPGHSALERAN